MIDFSEQPKNLEDFDAIPSEDSPHEEYDENELILELSRSFTDFPVDENEGDLKLELSLSPRDYSRQMRQITVSRPFSKATLGNLQ